MHRFLCTMVWATLLASPALAQQLPVGAMPGMAPPGPTASPAGRAMMEGMARMNHDMSAAPQSGNPDRDFVAMMIPHHQGAIDMAEVELRYGRDPFLRRLARDIIAAQAREIRAMRRWQANHP